METPKKRELNIRLPKRYEKADYKSVPENIKTIFEKIPTTRQGLYIHGSAGVGKTHIAYALLKAGYEVLHKNTKIYNTTELLHSMRNDFNKDCNKEYCISNEVRDYRGILIFDDIGAEKLSEWVQETFYLIINKRYNDMLPTIFTSNLSVPQLAEHFGDRITSRIVGMCDIVEIKGEDRRLTNN